jgi:CRISPR-associated Cas5-like protein
MTKTEAIEIIAEGKTCSFRVPISGTGLIPALPVPTYSHLLGLIACCKGEYFPPKNLEIGFEFMSSGSGNDIEKLWRWDINNGNPKLNKETAIREKQFYIDPILKLYVKNTELEPFFKNPKGVPTLGQSQDVIRIKSVKRITLEKRTSGKIGSTLIPYDSSLGLNLTGRIFKLPTNYIYSDTPGELRKPNNIISFIATSTKTGRQELKFDNLYHPDSFENNEDVIYFHRI